MLIMTKRKTKINAIEPLSVPVLDSEQVQFNPIAPVVPGGCKEQLNTVCATCPKMQTKQIPSRVLTITQTLCVDGFWAGGQYVVPLFENDIQNQNVKE